MRNKILVYVEKDLIERSKKFMEENYPNILSKFLRDHRGWKTQVVNFVLEELLNEKEKNKEKK